jgi:hypothetical protein
MTHFYLGNNLLRLEYFKLNGVGVEDGGAGLVLGQRAMSWDFN